MTRWRLREEFLDAETGSGHEVELTGQNGTRFQDGRSRLATVYVGKGAARDYDGIDVRGKAVIADRSDEISAATRGHNAAAAGALMIISVNDTRGRLYESYGDQEITSASVRAEEGARLIAEAQDGRGILKVEQKRFADYLFDLARVYKDAIPDTALVYRPTEDELAKVTSRYHGDKGVLGGGIRVYVPAREIGRGCGVGLTEYEKHPDVRTEYVSPPYGDSFWYENHRIGTGETPGIEQRGDKDRFRIHLPPERRRRLLPARSQAAEPVFPRPRRPAGRRAGRTHADPRPGSGNARLVRRRPVQG
ncbi:PA domain-containing protein [Streptomyces litmocidini]|uniref:PA domain-containing protein n=1 Tax=Streptomyces litmocidini TaxID=67318 RepID=A0ABW7UB71_9ACTN